MAKFNAKFKDHYKVLGVNPNASLSEIKKARRDLLQEYHPDKFKSALKWVQDAAEQKTKEINEAFDVLKDPIKRKIYDEEYNKHYNHNNTDIEDEDILTIKPKPEVDKSYIKFDSVTPGDIKTDYFIIRNTGGNYKDVDIFVENPNSWLRIASLSSLSPNQKDELPIKVELEANAEDWGSNYIEYIVIRIDDEEIKVIIALNTISKSYTKTIVHRNNVLKWKYAKLLLWTGTVGSSLAVLIAIISCFNVPVWSSGLGWILALIILTTIICAYFGFFIINKTKNFRFLDQLENDSGQAGAVFVMIIGGALVAAGIVFVVIAWFIIQLLIAALEKK